jgi:hypothetical protein
VHYDHLSESGHPFEMMVKRLVLWQPLEILVVTLKAKPEAFEGHFETIERVFDVFQSVGFEDRTLGKEEKQQSAPVHVGSFFGFNPFAKILKDAFAEQERLLNAPWYSFFEPKDFVFSGGLLLVALALLWLAGTLIRKK